MGLRRSARRSSVSLGWRRGGPVRRLLSVASLLRGVRTVRRRRILSMRRRVLASRRRLGRRILACRGRIVASVLRRVLALRWILAGWGILLRGRLAVLALARIALVAVVIRHLRGVSLRYR